MDKPAQTDYPIEEILKRRWSPRAFSDRMVESEKLQSLFEAARWAPSSFNEQPWSFIVAAKQKPEEHARLLSCLVEKNQQWARPGADADGFDSEVELRKNWQTESPCFSRCWPGHGKHAGRSDGVGFVRASDGGIVPGESARDLRRAGRV